MGFDRDCGRKLAVDESVREKRNSCVVGASGERPNLVPNHFLTKISNRKGYPSGVKK